MTFFLDINIPASFAAFLENQGHSVTIGAEAGFNGKSDWEIRIYAWENKEPVGLIAFNLP